MGKFSNGAVFIVLLLGVMLAFPVSFGLVQLYKSAVKKYMKASRRTNRNEPPADAPPETPAIPATPQPNIVVLDKVTPLREETNAAALYRKMRFGRWRAAAIYAVAGICFSLVMTVATLVGEAEFLPIRVILVTLIYAFPVVITVNIIAAATWGVKLAMAILYFAIFTFFTLLASLIDPAAFFGTFGLFLLYNLPGIILSQVFLIQKIRPVGALVLSFAVVVAFGSQIIFSIAGSSDELLKFLVAVADTVGLGATTVFISLFVFGALAAAPFGLLTFWMAAVGYEKKKISDQSIIIDAVWILSGIMNSLLLSSSDGWRGFSWILAFIIYRIVLWVGFSLLKSSDENKKLLVLRVFSLEEKSEKLFRKLSMYWRYAGSVSLITGPDLAVNNIKPNVLWDFVRGKLSSRFIDGLDISNRHFSELNNKVDWDGRFRVIDFFCHDNAWRKVLSHLVSKSDAVIMDLRDFSVKNEGCLHEINELINTVQLKQIVFIIDEKTDWKFLLKNFQNSWEQMKPTSPNRLSASAQLSFFRLTNSGGSELRQLLKTMCVAAQKT